MTKESEKFKDAIRCIEELKRASKSDMARLDRCSGEMPEDVYLRRRSCIGERISAYDDLLEIFSGKAWSE